MSWHLQTHKTVRFRGVYKAPKHPGVASHDCLRFKPLAVLVQGVGFFINLVPFFVGDSSNLNATVLLLVLKQTAAMRTARGQSPPLPHRCHIQLDGASTNWSKVMFGSLRCLWFNPFSRISDTKEIQLVTIDELRII